MSCRGITFVSPSKNFSDPAQEPKTSKSYSSFAQAASERLFPSSTNHNFSEDKISNQILRCGIHILHEKTEWYSRGKVKMKYCMEEKNCQNPMEENSLIEY